MQATFFDGTSNQTMTRDLEDHERLTAFQPQVALSASKLSVLTDGVDFVTITVQLHSVPMRDGKPVNIETAHTVILLIGETEIRLETDARGRVAHELEFDDSGVYSVRVQNLHSNVLEIKAV